MKIKKFLIKLICLPIFPRELRRNIRRTLYSFFNVTPPSQPLCVTIDNASRLFETYMSIPVQDEYDFSEVKKAKKLIVFVDADYIRTCGGVIAIFNYFKYLKEIVDEDTALLMTTPPGPYTYVHNSDFYNEVNLCRWEQTRELIKGKDDVLFMVTTGLIVQPHTKEEVLKNRLQPEDYDIFKTIKRIRINIIDGRIDFQPPKEKCAWLFDFAQSVTTTVVHPASCTQEICNSIGMPLHLLQGRFDLEYIKKIPLHKKQKLILLSPDLYNCTLDFKVKFIRKLNDELPEYPVCVPYGKKFDEYLRLVSVSSAMISFGEGYDAYFLNAQSLRTAGFAVYNDTFFPNENWKKYKNVYASYDDLYENFVKDFKEIVSSEENYNEFLSPVCREIERVYSLDDYKDALRRFYNECFDFYPSEKNRIKKDTKQPMKKVFIVGGNGFARECYYYLRKMQQNGEPLIFGGFMGHGGYGHTVDYLDLQKYYVGEVSEHKFKENECVVIGAGYPELRQKIYEELKQRDIEFFTIHLGEPFKKSVEVGEANVFGIPFGYTCNIKIGNANVFNGDVIVGHDCVIGNFNFFGPRSQILGEVKIGNFNTIGTNAVLLPHCKIGNNNKIAPSSTVYKGCRDNSYWGGNPAVKIGNIE